MRKMDRVEGVIDGDKVLAKVPLRSIVNDNYLIGISYAMQSIVRVVYFDMSVEK